ncbi:hypothetical protein F4860DRAFT_508608 [Xylaria cubensis]|nr:hypothetical protein F4860DRAFT_508608 [Xylaria cubensis]
MAYTATPHGDCMYITALQPSKSLHQDLPMHKHQCLQGEDQQPIEDTRVDDTSGSTVVDDFDPNNVVDFWRKEGRWPRQYFEPELEAQHKEPKYPIRNRPQRMGRVFRGLEPGNRS